MANQQQCPNAQNSLVFCSIIPPILHMNLVVPICSSYKSQSNLARGRSLWHKLRRKIYKPGFMQCHLLFAFTSPKGAWAPILHGFKHIYSCLLPLYTFNWRFSLDRFLGTVLGKYCTHMLEVKLNTHKSNTFDSLHLQRLCHCVLCPEPFLCTQTTDTMME
jgi:hypothetical protein